MKLSITISSLILLLSLLFPFKSFAQTLNNNSISLGFAPTAQYLHLKPGSKYNGEITAWNLSPQTRTFNILIRGFEQIENLPGTARVNTESEELRDPFSAASWIKVPYKKIFLIPNQYTKIPFEINVPTDSATGEFNAMVFIVSETPNVDLGPNSVSNSNLGSGPVLLVKVGDKVEEKAEIEYFKSEYDFYELPPVNFLTRYVNKSNTHIKPAGEIIIENFLGQEIATVPFNSNKQSLLRGASGNYKDEWTHKGIFTVNGKLSIGPLKARLITTYRSENPGYAPLNSTYTFWVLPYKHILVILLVVGIMYKVISNLTRKNEKKPSNKRDNSDFNYPTYA